MFLLAAPYFGVLLCLFLSHHRYRGYLVSRRSSERVMAVVHDAGRTHRPDTTPRVDPTPFERISELPAVRGNGLVPLIDGRAIFAAIAAARERVWIASPYCVPDTDILTALKHAALAGRDVRLLVPEMIDHHIPWLAAFANFDELREAGVQIWRYQRGFMRQKVVLVDDDFAAIGTTNLDNRSFRLNFEAMVAGFDDRFAAEVARSREADFANATIVEKSVSAQPMRVRHSAPVALLFAPLL